MELGIPDIADPVEIGVGASAQVFRARQVKLDREVAVKILSTSDPGFVRRFHREARTLGRLSQHEGIVTLYEFGETTGGKPYLLLELCRESLLDAVIRSDRLDPDAAVAIVADVAETLAQAHEAGVVHRDIKPANILLNQSGRYLLTDFGISTVLGSTSGQTSSVGFTAGYAAPETFDGRSHSGQEADVYALGATLFHLVGGRPPFARPDGDQNLLALINRIANEAIPDLRSEGVPAELCTVIEASMAKDPEARPDALEFAALLNGLRATASNPAVDAIDPNRTAPASPDLRPPVVGLSPQADVAGPQVDSWPPPDPQAAPDPDRTTAAPATPASDPWPAPISGQTAAAPPPAPTPTPDPNQTAAAAPLLDPNQTTAAAPLLDPNQTAAASATPASDPWPAPDSGQSAAAAMAHRFEPSAPAGAGPPPGPGSAPVAGAGAEVAGQRVPSAPEGAGVNDLVDRVSPVRALAIAAVLLAVVGFGVWRFVLSNDDGAEAADAVEEAADSAVDGEGDIDEGGDELASSSAGSDAADNPGADGDDSTGSEPAAPSTSEPGVGDGDGTTVGSSTGGTNNGGATTATTDRPTTETTERPTTETPTTDRPTTETTERPTTETPTTEEVLAISSISGPSSVECWSANQRYTAITNGVPVTSWNWSTGALGLQTPFNSGPDAVLSFDLDPGVYQIQVTANGSVSRSKQITVTEGPGCAGETVPTPIISGPAVVDCNSTHTYSVSSSNSVPLTSFSWSGPSVSSPSSQSTSITFGGPGTVAISVSVNGPASTQRTITINEPAGGC